MFRFVKIRIFRENYSPHFYRPSLSIRYKYNFPIPSSNNPARYLKKKKKIYENRILFRIQYISRIQLHLKINFIDRVTTIEQATNFLLRRIDPAREHFPSIHDYTYTHIYIYIEREKFVRRSKSTKANETIIEESYTCSIDLEEIFFDP